MLYLITIKRNAIDFTSINELKKQHNRLFRRFSTLHMCVELDSLKRLHLHSITEFKRTPYFKRYMVSGWYIYLNKIDQLSMYNTIVYIYKNSNEYYQREMELTSYANYTNMFVE